MYLARLYIKGFRSIAELDLTFQPGMNIIVGRNNSGKSNIIRALDLVLGESNPTWAKGDLITEKDFRSERLPAPDGGTIDAVEQEFFIWCELVRSPGEELDYEALYGCAGFYIHSEIAEWTPQRKPIKRPIRIPARDLPVEYADHFDLSDDDSHEKEYINPKLRNQGTFEAQFEHKYRFAFGLRVVRHREEIHRDLRFFYREGELKDWIMSFRAPIRNELLQSAIVPSFRDPDRQLRSTSWTWYGKLLRELTRGRLDDDKISVAFEEVRRLADDCFSQARDAVNASSLNVAFPGTELHFQFSADTRADLYKGCAIYVDDGQRSLLTEKGSGIQSAVIIGLFSYYTHHVNTVSSALLCIEEPELYLHPHAQRVISSRLTDFLAGGRHQVILTTHSPEFISARTGLESITTVRRSGSGTTALTAKLAEYRDLVLDLNQAELFFADRVVVCEGFDGYVLRAVAEELFPGLLDERNVSVISTGGKDGLDRMVAIVRSLGIEVFVMADFDYLLRDRSEADAKAAGGHPHKNIFALGEEYFSLPYLLGDKGQAAFRALQKAVAAVRSSDLKAFYTAKRLSDLEGMPFDRSLPLRLRMSGICILDGQIEDLIREPSILAGGKFDMKAVFRLSALRRDGLKVIDLIECASLSDFLRRLFRL